jgi:transcriptional regulator GlxA family with amidase domain
LAHPLRSGPAGTDIYFLVLPGTMLLDFAGTAEAFRVAADYGANFRLHYVAPSGQARCSLGLTLGGLGPLPDRLPDRAVVFIPGVACSAQDYRLPEARTAAQWLARTVGPAQLLCTVCSGAFLAAESGLLDGRCCTTHHSLTERLARDYPQVKVLENRIFVRDGQVFTSAGVTAGVDLALHLISDLAGAQAAVAVARLLVLYFRRAGADPQLSPWLSHRNHIDPRVHCAQDLVARDPAHDWSVAELADRTCTSPRNLGRLFQQHAGISPQAYVRRIRTAAARELIRQPGLNLNLVAEMVGFSSAEQLRRAWKRFERDTPARLRHPAAQPGAMQP